MPWTNLPTFTVGQVLTSTTMNQMRENANIGHLICTSVSRPVSPDPGTMIYETDTTRLMVYAFSGWYQVSTPLLGVEYLVVAGGGQGGGSQGTSIASGGGGAGGMLTNRLTGARFPITTGVAYTVTVGAGGANAATGFYTGAAGGNSVFSTITCIGGGGGGTWSNPPASGGSGGGTGENGQGYNAASGTAGQGYSGGNDLWYDSGTPSAGGGGGGAGGMGGDTQLVYSGGQGGQGRPCDITGSWVMYAGGGGGAGQYIGGQGGDGGGGYGASGSTSTGVNATANTGGGGGGSLTNANEATQRGGYGGSGVVVIRYPEALPAATVTGSPTVTTVDGDRVYRWTSTGTWSITF